MTVAADFIDTIYRKQMVEAEDGTHKKLFPVSLSRGVGEAFFDLIVKEKLERTIEVGMAFGMSTLFICHALESNGKGKHIAIDPFQVSAFQSIGLLNVKRARLEDRLEFYEAPSHAVLPRLIEKGTPIDFAFVDGMHTFDHTLVDFFFIDQLLRIGGFIAFDDLWMPSVRRVVSFILRNRSYESVSIDTSASDPLWFQCGRVARKLLQPPFLGRDLGLRLSRQRACVLRKTAIDDRAWNFHREF